MNTPSLTKPITSPIDWSALDRIEANLAKAKERVERVAVETVRHQDALNAFEATMQSPLFRFLCWLRS